MNIRIVSVVLLLMSLGPQPFLSSQSRTLSVYGSNGPLGPMRECADTFSRYHGIDVKVVAARLSNVTELAVSHPDVIFAGAEYLLAQIMDVRPDLIDKSTRTTLYTRAVGVLVRKGNPKQIKCLADLTRGDMRLLVVNGESQHGLWEDAASVGGLVHAIQRNIVVSTTTSAEAAEKWKSMPGIDAWLTYESWHYRLKEATDLVQLPAQERIHRGTPIAIAQNSSNKEVARQFIAYLKSDAAHAVFQKWGWE